MTSLCTCVWLYVVTCTGVLTVNITVMCSNHFLLTRVGNESAAITVGWLIFSHSSIRDVYLKQEVLLFILILSLNTQVCLHKSQQNWYIFYLAVHVDLFYLISTFLLSLFNSSSSPVFPLPLPSPLPFLFPLPSLPLSPPLPLPSPSYPPFFLLRTRWWTCSTATGREARSPWAHFGANSTSSLFLVEETYWYVNYL